MTPGEPQIGRAVRGERERLGWSVAALAARAGVSRAMVTRVERGEANATTAFLGKLSAAFGLQLSQLIARGETHAPRGLATEDEQGLWVDPETGHLRRQLSPPAGLAIELLEITLPARARVSYPPSAYAFVEQQIWMLEGTLQLREGGQTISLRDARLLRARHPGRPDVQQPGPGIVQVSGRHRPCGRHASGGPSERSVGRRSNLGRNSDAQAASGSYSRLIVIEPRGSKMQTYAILRRAGWKSPGDLAEAAGRSARVGDEDMPEDIRWIRSYVLEEGGGSVGTVCIYQASSPEAIRKHAQLADLPVDEIIAVADTVIVRPDPVAAEAG